MVNALFLMCDAKCLLAQWLTNVRLGHKWTNSVHEFLQFHKYCATFEHDKVMNDCHSIHLHKAYIDCILCYSLQLLQRVSLTSKTKLDVVLQLPTNVPWCTERIAMRWNGSRSNGCLPMEVLGRQGVLRIHLRHITQDGKQYLERITKSCTNSSFGQAVWKISVWEIAPTVQCLEYCRRYTGGNRRRHAAFRADDFT